MTRALSITLLLSALAASPQEDLSRTVEGIIPRLSDDAIDQRDRALQELVELGPAALPLLRKRMDDLAAEARGRLLEACQRIEARTTLTRFLPPLKKITLEWENKPAREALDEVARRTGITVDGSNANADGSITFSLKDASPIQAIDEVCRRAGLTWRSVDEESFGGRRRPMVAAGGARVMIQNGKAPDFPTSFLRHYRFRVSQVSLTRTNNFQASQSHAQMTLDLGWGPDVKPDGLHAFKITELKDDQGRSLMIEETDRFRGRGMRMMRGRSRGRDMGAYAEYLQFKFPEADAKAISLLRGSASFSYPEEIKTVSFEKPSESAGKSIDLNGLTITLQDCTEKGNGHSITLEMSGRFRGLRQNDPGEDDDPRNLPFSYEDVELVTEAGDSLRHQSMSSRSDGKTYTWVLGFEGETPSPPREIRIYCVLRRFIDAADFEIRDISLPK